MTKRKVLAAATLVALPLYVGASQTMPVDTTSGARTASTWQMTDQHAGPQWAYAWGMEGEEALVFAIVGALECSLLTPVGAVACGIAGAL